MRTAWFCAVKTAMALCGMGHVNQVFSRFTAYPLAEGIETKEEFLCLRDFGVELMQGYLFAKPSFESLPQVDFGEI